MIGQHLTLPRWIQIVLARIKGLSVLQGAGENLLMFLSNNSMHFCLNIVSVGVCLENTTRTGNEETGLFEDTQTDFRSILSFGVQPL